MSVSLGVSRQSPALVGQMVTWTAVVSGSSSANLWYRFRVRYRGNPVPTCHGGSLSRHHCPSMGFAAIKEYGPSNVLEWTAAEYEGPYEIEVSARDNDSGEAVETSKLFYFAPRTTGATPVISETAVPFVSLYSAPSCPLGSYMHVEFWSAASFAQSTNEKPCNGVLTMNFYIAGMPQATQYSMQHVIDNGSRSTYGPVLVRTTPLVSLSYGPYSVLQQPSGTVTDGILLHSRSGVPTATDWRGNVVWYYPGNVSALTRPEAGGFFLGLSEDQSVDSAHQLLREFDLAGTTIRETNAARASEQLAAMGMHSITGFHHEVRRLPDGRILALAATERILTDIQGPGPVDVLGDMILVFDQTYNCCGPGMHSNIWTPIAWPRWMKLASRLRTAALPSILRIRRMTGCTATLFNSLAMATSCIPSGTRTGSSKSIIATEIEVGISCGVWGKTAISE